MLAEVYEDEKDEIGLSESIKTSKCFVLSKSGTQEAKLSNIIT